MAKSEGPFMSGLLELDHSTHSFGRVADVRPMVTGREHLGRATYHDHRTDLGEEYRDSPLERSYVFAP